VAISASSRGVCPFRRKPFLTSAFAALFVILSAGSPAVAQSPVQAAPGTEAAAQVGTPAGYVIGPDDQLSVVFWRDKDLSADSVVVRADGMISLPLLNDVQAAGLTPVQLRDALQTAAARYVQDPVATVIVKQINSRKVFITGMINKPGAYAITGPMTTLQLIALAGGFQEFAKTTKIRVARTTPEGRQWLTFNYDAVTRGRRNARDIDLAPGDTVVVP